MKLNFKVIVVSLLAGFLVWVSDSLLDHLFFSQKNLLGLMLTDIPQHKLFMRILIVLYFFIFGSIISWYVKKHKESTEELEEYEFKYKTVADKTNDWEFWKDVDGKYKYISPAFEKITGYLVEDLIEKPALIKRIIHPDDLERVVKHLEAEMKNTLEISELEFRIITQNNKVKKIKHKCEPVYDKEGNFMGSRGSNSEIHKYTLVSDELSFDEALIKAQVEKNTEGVLAVNDSGKIVLMNDKFKRLWDITNETVSVKDEKRLMEVVLSKLKKPHEFIDRVEFLSNNSKEKSEDRLLLKNGKIMDSSSIPIIDSKSKYLGRIWYFKEGSDLEHSINQYRKNSELTDSILASVCQPLYIINANDYTIEKYNEAAGFDPDTQERKCFRLTHGRNEPCSSGKHPCPLKLVKETKASVVVHHKHYDKSGDLRLVEVHGYPIFDDDGNVEKVIEHSIDITDSTLVKEKLKSVEDKFTALFENAPDAFFTQDFSGTITNVNNAALSLTGYSKEELIGQNFLKLKLMSVNDALKASRLFTENKQGKPVGPHEFIIFRKDSSKVPVEMRAFPVDVNSQRLVFSVVRDVSERKLAERKAIETEKRFRGLYENSTLGIYRSTQEGRIVMANPAAVALLGFDSLDELLKINIADYYSDILVDRSAFKKIMDSEGVAHGFEFQWKRPDGTIIYLKESARTILNEKGKVEFYEGIFEDVTDKRKAEETLIKAKEEAEELSRLKSNFLANMSHELRTPLIGIEGYAEILYNELKEDELKQMARNIEASSDRLSKALDLILDFSMLEANKLKINSKRVNIVNAVKELINPFKKAAREKGLEFRFISDEEELFSYVDTNLFSRSVRHILDNSIKFTKHGEVGVKIFANGMINIQISDTGIGIPDDKMKIIFNPFRQISEGNSRLFQGIGLGLTLARKFTEVSGGKVLVESKVGKGTSFTILLPEAKSMEEFK